MEDGSILFLWNKRIILTDKCGKYLKHFDDLFYHHSIEKDSEGNIYVPIRFKTEKDLEKLKGLDKYNPGAFTVFDKNLKNQYNVKLLDIYSNNDLIIDVRGNGNRPLDPFHLNDVVPFKTKDGNKIVLLSLRNKSTVLAYDLSTKKIIWKIERAFTHQHDVDIISSNNNKLDITIFDNNAPAYGNKKGYISLGNQIVTFRDLPTRPLENVKLISQPHQFKKYGKEVESFSWLNKYMQPKTITQGLSEYIKENNSLMIEEQNYGRIFEYEIDSKKMLWEYINKESKESNPLYVGWSRRMLDLPGKLNKKSFNSCYGL